MLRTFGESRGFRTIVVGCLTGVVAFALAIDPADAKGRRRHAKKGGGYNPPYSAIVVDANSGAVLHSTDADGARHPASVTKIMTLYLLFEQIEAGKIKLDTPMKVSAHAAAQSPTKLGLKPGETITVEDAIRGLVTRSANDAAVVIAEHIAGDEEAFAKLMTRKARALGMNKTIYMNASGLPDRDQITTARDQAQLGRAIQDRFPRQYRFFSTKSFTFRGNQIGNHNHLLGSVRGVDGIKTGYIQASGFNLVASMKRDNRYLVAVVMGGSSGGARDARMRSLLEQYVTEASVSRTAPVIAEREIGEETPVAVAAVGEGAQPAAPKPAASQPAASQPDSPANGNAPAPATPISSTRTTPAKPATARVVDPIKPIAVKTVKVKLNGVQTASLTPSLSQLPVIAARNETATATAFKPAAEVPAVPTQAVAAAQPSTAAAERKPAIPAATALSAGAAAPASPAPEPADAAPSAASLPIQVASAGPLVSMPAPAAQPAPQKVVRTGWVIQVGAFEAERDARDRLSSAQTKAKQLLAGAEPFTESVVKDNRTFYRARFAGFAKEEAEAACKYLKRNDFACIALKN